MKVTPLSPNTWQLTHMGFVNCYLVRQDGAPGEQHGSFTLIDTAMGAAKPILVEAARLTGSIRHIVLTHAHMDHIGSLDALAAELGGTPASTAQLASLDVAISARESRLLPRPPAQDRSLEPSELALAPGSKVKGSLPGASTPATHMLMEGELFGSLRCLATPGHTPGHFSFFDERDGTLYAGDSLLTIGGHAHVPGYGPWYFPIAGFATWHSPTAAASIARLREMQLPIQRIAPGHGPVLTGGNELLSAALSHTK